jgi:hypothetical protein
MTRKHTNETRLILIGDESGREFIGAWAIPGRLPEMHRFPLESREMFSQRCRLALTGHGTALGWLMYADALQLGGTMQCLKLKGNT